MADTALRGLAPEWFTPEDQEHDDAPARYKLKALKPPQVARLQKEFNADTGAVGALGLYGAAKDGIVDWENVNDQEGNPLRFTRANIDELPYARILELGGQVLANSFLTGEDEKNS